MRFSLHERKFNLTLFKGVREKSDYFVEKIMMKKTD